MFQILSLSGGGYLGLYSISLLAEFERETSTPIATRFNLLAGTSIGGIVALGLAAEVPAARIQSSFVEHGQRIFGNSPPPTSAWSTFKDLAFRSWRAKHDPGPLRATIEDIVGAETRLGDLKHPVIVPTVNLSTGRPQVFKTPHHEDFRLDQQLKIADVAMAASAAPTYFPLAKVSGALYTDGGLFANSPDLLALHEALRFFGEDENDVYVFSVGTTTSQFSFAHSPTRSLGITQWFRDARLLNVIIGSQQRSTEFMMKHRLGDRYLRLDAEQSKEQERILGLDVATNDAQETIMALARGTFQQAVNNITLKKMLGNKAPSPKFFHSAQGDQS